MARLIWSTASGERELTLAADAVLGRSAEADIVIDDETVSRRHARILVQNETFTLHDLGSGNGTVLNGALLHQPAELKDDDEFLLGKVRFLVRTTDEERVSRGSVLFDESSNSEALSVIEASGAAPLRRGEELTTSARLRMIAEVASAMAQLPTEEAIFTTVVDRLFNIFVHAERVCVILRDPESGELSSRVARSRNGAAEQVPVSRAVLDQVISGRQAIACADAADDDRFAGSTVLQYSLRTFACAPMIAGDEVLGVIQADTSDPARAFNEDDVATLLAVAAQTALSISNRRMHQTVMNHQSVSQDLALAKRIQMRFLPEKPPTIKGYSFEAVYRAALGVGGDYYDFLPLSEKHHAIVIGDVSGKGISAALYMAKLSSEMRHHVIGKADAADILKRLNRALVRELEEGMFVTFLLMILNLEKAELQVASAGHPSPIIRQRDGEVLPLLVPGNQPLGMDNYGGFEQQSFHLGAGDIVVAYTDGVSEAMNNQKQLFGDERLFGVIEHSDGTAVGMKDSIVGAVENFRQGAIQNDDLTLICFGPVAK